MNESDQLLGEESCTICVNPVLLRAARDEIREVLAAWGRPLPDEGNGS